MTTEMGLIQAMSDEDLAGLKDKYADNPSVATLIEGILQTRQNEAEQVKVRKQFTNGIERLFSKLAHPEDIHNVYARWGEADVADGEPVEVEVTVEGEKVTEMRTPSHKEFCWIVEVNHATKVQTSVTGEPKVSKRAITVYKRDGTQLEIKGHFASASKACEKLGLTIGGDSAMRVLARDGYITEPYDGTDFAS